MIPVVVPVPDLFTGRTYGYDATYRLDLSGIIIQIFILVSQGLVPAQQGDMAFEKLFEPEHELFGRLQELVCFLSNVKLLTAAFLINAVVPTRLPLLGSSHQ
jgi:hypothetical protein